jgi:hypothetical protein
MNSSEHFWRSFGRETKRTKGTKATGGGIPVRRLKGGVFHFAFPRGTMLADEARCGGIVIQTHIERERGHLLLKTSSGFSENFRSSRWKRFPRSIYARWLAFIFE